MCDQTKAKLIRRACLPPLVARAGASSVQDCRSRLQSSARTRSAIPRSAKLRRHLPGRRPLRSAGTNRLAVPPVKLTTVANRAFLVVGPRTWNDLPDDVTSAETLSTFRQRLKTHLFTKSFFTATCFSNVAVMGSLDVRPSVCL